MTLLAPLRRTLIPSPTCGTPLVSRHFTARNTVPDVTYTTMNGPDLTFPLREA